MKTKPEREGHHEGDVTLSEESELPGHYDPVSSLVLLGRFELPTRRNRTNGKSSLLSLAPRLKSYKPQGIWGFMYNMYVGRGGYPSPPHPRLTASDPLPPTLTPHPLTLTHELGSDRAAFPLTDRTVLVAGNHQQSFAVGKASRESERLQQFTLP